MVWTCDEDWLNKCMEFRAEGRIPVGRPRRTWLLLFATIRSVFKSVKVSVVEIAKRTN